MVSLADQSGNPRLGIKSEDSDYQGSSEKNNIQFLINREEKSLVTLPW